MAFSKVDYSLNEVGVKLEVFASSGGGAGNPQCQNRCHLPSLTRFTGAQQRDMTGRGGIRAGSSIVFIQKRLHLLF